MNTFVGSGYFTGSGKYGYKIIDRVTDIFVTTPTYQVIAASCKEVMQG
jgi:hypothetical protein